MIKYQFNIYNLNKSKRKILMDSKYCERLRSMDDEIGEP